ncbi:SRPBCC family protein [Pararhodonellum marinum]|uniref:SRPBCC family protein n=1 Tax=Pararhodonellum marinum TaxID=2755358 RepID=UPI00188FF97A|nr:SRPBCC family protein [Pararhodonellum marinum]
MTNLTTEIYHSLKKGLKSIGPAVSLFSGAYLMYLGTQKKNIPLSFAGGYLIFNGGLKFGGLLDGNLAAEIDDGLEKISTKVSFLVNRPKNEVYTSWRSLANLPIFMHHLAEVNELDAETSKWHLSIPGSKEKVVWINRIKQDKPYKKIAWQSDENAFFQNKGSIGFKKVDDFSTKVSIDFEYKFNPAFKPHLEELNTPLFEKMLENDLNNFKLYAENQLPSKHELK